MRAFWVGLNLRGVMDIWCYKLLFVFTSFFLFSYADCPDLFFECVGDRVPADIIRPLWTYDQAKVAQKNTKDSWKDVSSPLVDSGQVWKPLKLVCSQKWSDEVLRHVCQEKFGVAEYQLCSVPSQLCNKIYVKMPDGQYHIRIEPMARAAAKALEAAYTSELGKPLRRLMPADLTKVLSSVYGFYKNITDPKKTAAEVNSFLQDFGWKWQGTSGSVIDAKTIEFSRALGVDPNEWVVPVGGYGDYNSFFTRSLKPNARQITAVDDDSVVVSPADSKLTVVENVDHELSVFSVKQEDFTLESFLGNSNLAYSREFAGGTLLIFRLSPYNYHRYHMPINGVINSLRWIKISGLESVDPVAYKTGIDPLIINKRELVVIDSAYGPVLMVIVGAYNVGSIQTTLTVGKSYKKGDEVGYFAFGGSTLALLFKKGTLAVEGAFVDHSIRGFETSVKMGERVGQFLKKA